MVLVVVVERDDKGDDGEEIVGTGKGGASSGRKTFIRNAGTAVTVGVVAGDWVSRTDWVAVEM